MTSREEMLEVNKKRSLAEIKDEIELIGGVVGSVLYETTQSVDTYAMNRNAIDNQLLVLQEDVRYLKGEPSFDQNYVLEKQKEIEAWKTRWDGILHVVNLEIKLRYPDMQ